MTLAAIILTLNEAQHVGRAIRSLAGVADAIVVVDSGSSDGTPEIARSLGATVLEHPWQGYARQFNWALDQIGGTADWILRLDADEYLTAELVVNLKAALAHAGDDIAAFSVPRRMKFQGKMIRFGGVFPVNVVRIFRPNAGRCEARWMDEHISVHGRVRHLKGALVDDNRKSLTWWTEKNNRYANREVLDLLMNRGAEPTPVSLGPAAGRKRWIKQTLYARFPPGVRASLYFFYRFGIRLGFLDGARGMAFHVLQGFWYRYLVDAKLMEVERFMADEGATLDDAAKLLLGVDLSQDRPT